MGRPRQIIIPIRARSRSIENVTDARLENILAGVASNPRTDVFMELCLKHNSRPPRNDYLPEAVYWLKCEK